jgi:hypothetical protein
MLAAGCASSPPPNPSVAWEFFAPASPQLDAWYPKVAEWQTRARVDRLEPLPRPPEQAAARRPLSRAGLDPLPEQLGAFASAQRRLLAERIFYWTRTTAPYYYESDRPTSEEPTDGKQAAEEQAAEDLKHDYWPTYSELAERNGDDCDGLDLVAYRMLQEFGFPQDELFRAVVRRDRDAANHMLTFWFEDPSDPWVFDATGAATKVFGRFSDISGWTPTAIFNERDQYAARRSQTRLSRSAQARGAALD